ncbi:MAG: hypothetical protein RLZZ450_312 [Pseudomonadota bacterium]
MSALASLRARLKRLEQDVAAGPDDIDRLIQAQPIAVLIELSSGATNPSPRMQAAFADLSAKYEGDEFMRRLIERLAAEHAATPQSDALAGTRPAGSVTVV